MGSRNLSKVKGYLLKGDQLAAVDFPVNGMKALKQLKTLQAKAVEKSLYEMFAPEYVELRKKGHGKAEAKSIIKAKVKAKLAEKQSGPGQEEVLPQDQA